MIIVLAVPLTVMAQKDLSVGRYLGGNYRKNPAVTDVEITGEKLRYYGLSYYHSITVNGDRRLMEDVKSAFAADESKAADKEVVTVGGRLSTAMYRLMFDGAVNRFLFFKDLRLSAKKENAVMVIYMEGHTSLKELQKKFKK